MNLAFLGTGNPSVSAAFNLRKAKLIFDLGKHTLNLATTSKEIESSRNILFTATRLLNQAQRDITEAGNAGEIDAVLVPLVKQSVALSIELAPVKDMFLSKMASIEGLGAEFWKAPDWEGETPTSRMKRIEASIRRIEASKSRMRFEAARSTAEARRELREWGATQAAARWSRALRESRATPQQFDIPLLPVEVDPIASFRESIDMALDNARQGESRAALAHLEKALVKSRSFQNPEFANSILTMTRWFISKRAEKTLADKIQSIRDSLSRAMETIDEGDLPTAILYTDYAEKTARSIPPAMSDPFKRLIATVDSLIEDTDLRLKWRGLLKPKQAQKLAKMKKKFEAMEHMTFARGSAERMMVFPVERTLNTIEKSLTMAEKIMPTADLKAAKMIRRAQDLLQLTVKNAPDWEWDEGFSRLPTKGEVEVVKQARLKLAKGEMSKEEFEEVERSLHRARFREDVLQSELRAAKTVGAQRFNVFIGRIRDLANRIFKLSMRSQSIRKTIQPEEA